MEEAERRRIGKDVQLQEQEQEQEQHQHHAPALSPLPHLAFRFMIPDWLRHFSQSLAARLLPKAFVARRWESRNVSCPFLLCVPIFHLRPSFNTPQR
jgi:hypothetical protein